MTGRSCEAHKRGHGTAISGPMRFIGSLMMAGIIGAANAHAVPIESIEAGESYYINKLFAENDLVRVLTVDRSRGLVKVQYINGVVDWVQPSGLLTRSEARQADTDETVKTVAVIGGVLWAILDPKGFKDAMGNTPSSRTPTESVPRQTSVESSAVAISGVPFSPVLPSEWMEEEQKWIVWAQGTLRSKLDAPISIEAVRTRQVPLYPAGNQVVLVECIQTNRIGAYYFLAVRGSSNYVLLDGQGGPIHEFNRALGLSLDTAAKAATYLKFFTSSISADSGIFLVLEPGMQEVGEQALKEIDVSPIRVSPNAQGGWRIDADVLYGSDVYSAVFEVTRDGTVDMVEDRHKRQVAFDYLVVMNAGRRMYVGN